jgi:hypothetical protein
MSKLTMQLNELGKQEQTKPKISKRKATAKINEIQTLRTTQNINDMRREAISNDKTDKHLARLAKFKSLEINK